MPVDRLEKVAKAAAMAAAARQLLHENIREARAAGLSLRAIADAAHLSHEQVRRIAE